MKDIIILTDFPIHAIMRTAVNNLARLIGVSRVHSTRTQILQLIRDEERVTVDHLAQKLGLSPMTIRHHLALLQRDGLIQAEVMPSPGRRGRPRLMYVLTPAGAEMFPSNVTRLAHVLLLQLKKLMPPAELNAFLDNLADAWADSFPPVEGISSEAKLDQITMFLNNMGYQAVWEYAGSVVEFRLENCPYRWLAGRHPELCLVDMKLLQRLTGGLVQAVEEGQDEQPDAPSRICRYRVVFPQTGALPRGGVA